MISRVRATLNTLWTPIKEFVMTNFWWLPIQVVGTAIVAAWGITFSDLSADDILQYVRLLFDSSPAGSEAMTQLKQRNEHVDAIPLFIVLAPALVGLLVLVRFRLVASVDDTPRSTLSWNIFVMIGVAFFAVLLLPLLFALIASLFGIPVFTCDRPRMRDFTLLVFDSLAKGALLDLLESFHIDLYSDRCPPNKNSWVASSVIFLMRLFSTYIVVWLVVSWSRSLLNWAGLTWSSIAVGIGRWTLLAAVQCLGFVLALVFVVGGMALWARALPLMDNFFSHPGPLSALAFVMCVAFPTLAHIIVRYPERVSAAVRLSIATSLLCAAAVHIAIAFCVLTANINPSIFTPSHFGLWNEAGFWGDVLFSAIAVTFLLVAVWLVQRPGIGVA